MGSTSDHDAIRRLNQLVFGQDDEARLVDDLRNGDYLRVSLIAEQNGEIIGHILFSDLPILTDAGQINALALAPMVVLPEYQNQGIGSALILRGLELCREQGHRIVVVLGHPNYYPRFGFSSPMTANLASPFSGEESFMAMELIAGALDGVAGRAQYPPPFGAWV
jgi:putative acetyltransferase